MSTSNSQTTGKLSEMQQFFLNTINNEDEEVNPCYLANLYYESIGKRMGVSSRSSFGQTSAAYRTCRKLTGLKLIEEIHHKTNGGYSYTTYKKIYETI
jgi:hypothetical protein